MTIRKSRSKMLAALDAELEAKAQKLVASMKDTRARAERFLEEQRLKSEAARIAGEPDYFGLSLEEVARVLSARAKALEAETVADKRAAQVEELSLLRLPVRKIAEQLGLSYYYVVELRRKLGVSRARPRRK